MSETKYTVAIAVAICYLGLKFIEMRFISKEEKSLKELFKGSLLVFISTILGMYIIDQFGPLTETITKSAPVVFTSEPDF